MQKSMRFALSALVAGLVLVACGGGGSGGGGAATDPVVRTGVLTDAAVSGVPWKASPSNKEGTTDSGGRFGYVDGDQVTFTIGGLEVVVPGAATVTPSVIAAELFSGGTETERANATTNLAILLQTLDADSNAGNGLDLSGVAAIEGFNLSDSLIKAPVEFVAELNDNDTVTPGDKVAVAPRDAIEHYYGQELVGTWVFDQGGALRVLLVDKNGFYLLAVADRTAGTGQYESGLIKVSEDGKVSLDGSGETSYGSQASHVGAAVLLSGSSLALGQGESAVSLTRLANVRDSFLGSWVFLASSGVQANGTEDLDAGAGGLLKLNDAQDYSVLGTNANSSKPNSDKIFMIALSASELLVITTDVDSPCYGDDECASARGTGTSEDESNGVVLAKYSLSGDRVLTLDETPIDTVGGWDSGDFAQLDAVTGQDLDRGFAESLNGSFQHDDKLTIHRFLSRAEKSGSFSASAPAVVVPAN